LPCDFACKTKLQLSPLLSKERAELFGQPPESVIYLRPQNVAASQNKRNINVSPDAFTEQGVAMLSGILNSEKAISMIRKVRDNYARIR